MLQDVLKTNKGKNYKISYFLNLNHANKTFELTDKLLEGWPTRTLNKNNLLENMK